ncbi:MAG: HK97-gp10 family putative phage morphogenesis protein [Bacillota bacterium]
MTMRVEVQGGGKLAKIFAQASEQATNAAEKALLKGALLVERDAKQNTPVDTGRLRASITHRLSGAGTERVVVEIGTATEYAPFVEFGTTKMTAQPFLNPALKANKDKVKQMVADAVRKELGL